MSKACRRKNVSVVNRNFFNYFEHNINSLVNSTKSPFNIRTRTDICHCDFSIWWVCFNKSWIDEKKNLFTIFTYIMNKLTSKSMCQIYCINF